MKITVLNGSPKGDLSVTMQYVKFIEKKYPQHNLKKINIASAIKKIEKSEEAFNEIIEEVKTSDGVIWAFPLYYLLVQSGYKRFIELINIRGAEGAFKDKYATALSTSIHFFDHTAHNYINAISDDLNMRYINGFSPEMHDLLKSEGQEGLLVFTENFFSAITNELKTPKKFLKIKKSSFKYKAGKATNKIDSNSKRVVVITDGGKDDKNLNAMVDRFRGSFITPPELVNINNIDIKGGCLGCCRCGYDNTCVYEGKDGYIDFYRDKVMGADILVFAGAIVDRYLSSDWKRFYDRSFFMNHSPTMGNKQVGFIISGPLSQVPNLTEIFKGYMEGQSANVVDFITDECEDSRDIDAHLDFLAERLVSFAKADYVSPATFLGVGGRKIFRDDVWGKLRFPFVADHKYYKKHGYYDFPQKKDWARRIKSKVLILLTKIPQMRKEIYVNKIKDEMIKPFVKVLEKADGPAS
jgi:multimeric flavodoxin WrbA